MRTTITLDDRLLAQLKKRAAASGTSVSRLVEQAVRLFIRTPAAAKRQERFELVKFGRGGRFSLQNIDKTSRLIENPTMSLGTASAARAFDAAAGRQCSHPTRTAKTHQSTIDTPPDCWR